MKLPIILILLTGLGWIVPNMVSHAQTLKRQEALELSHRLDLFGTRRTY